MLRTKENRSAGSSGARPLYGRVPGVAADAATRSRSVREQGQPIAVEDLDPIALLERRLRRRCHRLLLAVVELDGHDPVAFLLDVLLHLIAGQRADTDSGDRRHGISAARADLVADHAACNSTDHCA